MAVFIRDGEQLRIPASLTKRNSQRRSPNPVVFHGYAGDFSANQLGVCEERSLPYSKSVEFSESDVDEDGSRSGGFHRRVSEAIEVKREAAERYEFMV
jgi:hypothetical protein